MQEVEFNRNPDNIVFKQGVFNAFDNKFGRSEKDEFVNDDMLMGLDWEAPDAEKIEFVKQEQLSKIIRNEEEMQSFCSHLSTGYHGTAFRGACFNLGPDCALK